MATERETKTVKTSGGTDVVYKAWISGGEFNELQSVWLSGASVKMDGNEAKIDGFSPTLQYEAQEKMIELLVVSVGGDTNGCLQAVKDLPRAEYDEVVAVLEAVSGKKK